MARYIQGDLSGPRLLWSRGRLGLMDSADGMFQYDTITSLFIFKYTTDFDGQVPTPQRVGSTQPTLEDVEATQREMWRC